MGRTRADDHQIGLHLSHIAAAAARALPPPRDARGNAAALAGTEGRFAPQQPQIRLGEGEVVPAVPRADGEPAHVASAHRWAAGLRQQRNRGGGGRGAGGEPSKVARADAAAAGLRQQRDRRRGGGADHAARRRASDGGARRVRQQASRRHLPLVWRRASRGAPTGARARGAQGTDRGTGQARRGPHGRAARGVDVPDWPAW
mmetsp:Transcript_30951/g.77266  ORF Transcript_30951/g.77266 Transcript_30951/m.77266 type:complete len:202 (+) Transcript_30951:787-1392(+)